MPAGAVSRPVLDDLVDRPRRQQRAALALMPWLSALLTPRRVLAAPWRRAGRIGAGRLRRVPRRALGLALELRDPLLLTRDPRRQLLDLRLSRSFCVDSANKTSTAASRPWSQIGSASARSTARDSTAPGYVPNPTERLRLSGERLKGFEPSTFCMAIRGHSQRFASEAAFEAGSGRFRQVRSGHSGTKSGTSFRSERRRTFACVPPKVPSVSGHVYLREGARGAVWYAKWRDATGQHQKALGAVWPGRGPPPAGILPRAACRRHRPQSDIEMARYTLEE